MSHTVVRGQPTAAQLYLDTVIDEVLQEQGISPTSSHRANVTLSQILLHCLKKRPMDEFMTNGATGEVITNEQLLKRAIPLARALTALGARGKHALFLMRNHQDMAVIYFAVLFTGIILFPINAESTDYEISYFRKLIEPSFIFCDTEFSKTVEKSLQGYPELSPLVVVVDKPGDLQEFSKGYTEDTQDFQVASAAMNDTVMCLSTSGSTGIPKPTALTHAGLVVQLPGPWMYHTKFPTPTARVMVLSTNQWLTFTTMVTSCVVYRVPLIISPNMQGWHHVDAVTHVIHMLENFRPTWTFLAPRFVRSLMSVIRPEQLTSLQTLLLLGAPTSTQLYTMLKEKLPSTTHLCNAYGITETHGFIAIPDSDTPCFKNGRVFNFMHYKIVNDKGEQLGLGQTGELYVKGDNLVKGYHKDMDSYNKTFIDGWYKTGDIFHVDENEQIEFLLRTKFSFKFRGGEVAPEEVERVILSVPGVQESVVCATDNGPAAAVVVMEGYNVSREEMHQAVNSLLSDHKRLHGGIAFVTSLPHTHSGKIKRIECSKLLQELVNNGQCY